jgi:hemerythrin-like domain-containing protein
MQTQSIKDTAGARVHDPFEALDACHRDIEARLRQLSSLVEGLASGPDAPSRALAREICHFFSTVARQHHEDEERHVFPALLASQDPKTKQAALRLQQDHGWLEEDWLELEPQLDAVAAGMSWYDFDTLREGVKVFTALSRDHMALEESLAYPQARAAMNVLDQHAAGREMAARRRALKLGH